MLFLKVVDGRFSVWRSSNDGKGKPIQSFEQTIRDPLRDRINKWKNSRTKTLFGREAPAPMFIAGLS